MYSGVVLFDGGKTENGFENGFGRWAHAGKSVGTKMDSNYNGNKINMAKINKSKRVTVHIPEGTRIHEFLSKNNNLAKWELLNDLVEQLPKSKEEKAVMLFDNFVKNICDLYPEIKTNLNVLRPYVFRRLIKGESLDAQYFEELKKI